MSVLERRRSFVAATALVALALVAWLMPARASAAAALVNRVAMGRFDGPGASRVRDAVESALVRSCLLVPTSALEQAAQSAGVALSTDADYGVAGKALKLDAIVTGTAAFRQRIWQVEVVVRRGDGLPVGRFAWADPAVDSIAAAIGRMPPEQLYAAALVPPVPRPAPLPVAPPPLPEKPALKVAARAPAPPMPPPSATVTASAPRPADPVVTDGRPAPHLLQMGAAARVFSRTLSYTDNLSRLPAYRLKAAAAAVFDLEIHPWARHPASPLRRLGLLGGLSYGLAVATAIPGRAGVAYTDVNGFEVGLNLRVPAGLVEIIPRLTYMGDNFVANLGSLSPDVRYRVIRLGAGTQMGIASRANLRAAADYLHVLDSGPIGDRLMFPRASASGVHAQVGAGYEVTPSIEAQATVALRRYAFAMNARRDDALVVGGAVDEYVSMTLGIAFRPRPAPRPR